jgi:O-methyltransferase
MTMTHNPTLQRMIAGSLMERLFLSALSKAQIFMLSRHKEPNIMRLIRQVRKSRTSLQSAYEQYMVYSLGKGHRRVPGDMAEVGVFQGASAKLLCDAAGDKTVHLFDTFDGLPKSSAQDHNVHAEKEYACSLESVQAYLKDYENARYYKGLFPESADGMVETTFSFVHCDVDLYESTLACLRYFYPRMTKGGVILFHDYSILAGVKLAFEEFLHDKLEVPIELPSTQCMLIKL